MSDTDLAQTRDRIVAETTGERQPLPMTMDRLIVSNQIMIMRGLVLLLDEAGHRNVALLINSGADLSDKFLALKSGDA